MVCYLGCTAKTKENSIKAPMVSMDMLSTPCLLNLSMDSLANNNLLNHHSYYILLLMYLTNTQHQPFQDFPNHVSN